MILAEIEHRKKRAAFDHYVDSIYTLCYPSGNLKVAKPHVDWAKAESIRNKFYFDEIIFNDTV